MVSTSSKILATSVVLGAIIYQTFLKSIIFDVMGYGRTLSPLSSFNVRCEKIDYLGLEACEDMWLHEPSGLLYLACSNSLGRVEWFPPSDHLNASAAALLNDRIAILDTRASGPISERLRWMKTSGFVSADGDEALVLHGLDIRADNSDLPKLTILLVNHLPPKDPQTGSLLDAEKVGGNSTIEVFETVLGDVTMKHIKTYHDPAIDTPNNVAWVSDESFVFTNDHTTKVGFRRSPEIPLKSGGTVGYCDPKGCRLLSSGALSYPNGIAFGRNGLVYVANTVTGVVDVNELQPGTSTLKLVNKVKIPYPIDNLAIDSNGDVFVASFPQTYKFLQSAKSPADIFPPTAAWRIRRSKDGTHQAEKILEDDGSELPSATVVVHDPKTDRIFLGGVYSPFISICEPR